MTELKIGDIVPHRLTGKKMRILEIGEFVCRCEQVEEPKEWVSGLQVMRHPLAICSIENLSYDQSQLPLFQL
jgi:hypothetical protein